MSSVLPVSQPLVGADPTASQSARLDAALAKAVLRVGSRDKALDDALCAYVDAQRSAGVLIEHVVINVKHKLHDAGIRKRQSGSNPNLDALVSLAIARYFADC